MTNALQPPEIMKNTTIFLLAMTVLTAPAPGDERPAADAEAFVWPSAVPAGCPFPRSETLKGVRFTGRHQAYRGGDTWYPCWAEEQGFFLNFPSKFISADGKTLWLCYSANFSPGHNGENMKRNPPGVRGTMRLHELQLLPKHGR